MPNPKNETCYERAYLGKYLVEKLSEVEESEVLDHLNECSQCQQEMEKAAADQTMWHSLKKHVGVEELDGKADQRIEQLLDYLAPTDDPEMIGRLGNYEVVGLVGSGSTGIVLKALERRLNRFVAIKVLSPVYSTNGAARKRFEREGRAVAAVSHEHVVPIYAVDEFRGLPYIVMKYIPGLSLLQRIEKEGALETCEVARIGLQVAEGLAAAHAQGIVHRDVKPANVLLEETVDRAMVTDFGLARVADEASMTRSGTIAGTPSYMSPEQAMGETVDPRSDLFSLGSLMYAACTARPPFRAETLFGVIHRVCKSNPRPIREINPSIDEWMVAFIDRLISKDPQERFQSASEVASELAFELAHLQNPTVAPKPPRKWMAKPVPLKKAPSRMAFVALVTVFLAACGALAFSDFGQNWLGLAVSKKSPDKGVLSPAQQQDWVETTNQDEEGADGLRTFWKANEVDFDTDSKPSFDQKIEQTFSVEQGGLLSIDVDRGDVVIQPSELSDRVQVTALRRVVASSQAEAELIVSRHELAMDLVERANELKLVSRFSEEVSNDEAFSKFPKILYRLSVPKSFNHLVKTGDGSITLGELAGEVEAITENGGIESGRIDGDVEFTATAGDIHLQEGITGRARITTVRGNAYVCNVDQESLVRTSGGSVWLGGSKGFIRAQTAGGGVKVTKVDGPLRVHACGGNVVVNLSESPADEASFTATNGDVTLRVTENVAAELVNLYPGENEEEDTLSRDLNGGGAVMKVGAPSGEVNLFEVKAKQAKSLGGSGLGGSGLGGENQTPTEEAIAKTKGDPRPGAIATIRLDESDGMDGYTLYLPVSHGKADKKFPILVYLQGAWGVGGPIENVNLWGMLRLLRDENDLSTERNQLLLDSFIVISPHINDGQYHSDPAKVQNVIEEVAKQYGGDLDRVYATGLSRGGHGSWGLAAELPNTFAAIAPLGGSASFAEDYRVFENVSVWVGHNQGDTTVEFEEASRGVRKIEMECEVEFLKLESTDFENEDLLSSRYVLCAPKVDGHDIWTETYTSAEFYQWLLAQSRSGAVTDSEEN